VTNVNEVVEKAGLSAFAGKRVLLTGDTGFKGSWLALWLSELGAEVHGLALPVEPGNVLFPAVAASGRVHHIDGDIRDLDTVRAAVDGLRPEFVFHLAAQALVRRSYAEPQLTFHTNVIGSVNVLEAVRLCPSVRSLVYITSDKCYLNKEWLWGYRENDELGGHDPYSASKAAAELAFHAYAASFLNHRAELGAATTRAGNVIGGGDRSADRIVPDTIKALSEGRPVILRNPGATRPWQHVLDPLYGYLKLGAALHQEPKRYSGSWNFGPDDRSIRTVGDLARAVIDVWGEGEVIHQVDPNAPHEANLLHLSSDKAHRQLGWHALWDFERAATETASWYRAVHDGAAPLEVARQQIARYMTEVSPR
jgi:CDP-glucose 4,6-dehydratase